MLKLEPKEMRTAIEKAKAVHPKVKVINADKRTYAVTGSKGGSYTVKFVVVNGLKLAECDCRARGMCFHIAAAASVNIAIQNMRESTPTPGGSKGFIARNIGWMV